MIWGQRLKSPCPACLAKDGEISRLATQLEKVTAEVLELARDATGHSRRSVPMDPPLAPLPDGIQNFLDLKFGYGSPLWKQQTREARRLVDTGLKDYEVVEKLSRGKQIEGINA